MSEAELEARVEALTKQVDEIIQKLTPARAMKARKTSSRTANNNVSAVSGGIWGDRDAKTDAVANDFTLIGDSQDSNISKTLTISDLQKTLVTDVDGDENDISNVNNFITNGHFQNTETIVNAVATGFIPTANVVYLSVSGVSTLELMDSENLQNGTEITLIAAEAFTLQEGGTTSGDLLPFTMSSTSFAMNQNDSITFVLRNDFEWIEKCRSVNS